MYIPYNTIKYTSGAILISSAKLRKSLSSRKPKRNDGVLPGYIPVAAARGFSCPILHLRISGPALFAATDKTAADYAGYAGRRS
jgi:hypothetical protein